MEGVLDALPEAAPSPPDYGGIARAVARAGGTQLGVNASTEDLMLFISKITWPLAITFALQLCEDPVAALSSIANTPQLTLEPLGPLDMVRVTAFADMLRRQRVDDDSVTSLLHVALAKRSSSHAPHSVIVPIDVAWQLGLVVHANAVANRSMAVFIPSSTVPVRWIPAVIAGISATTLLRNVAESSGAIVRAFAAEAAHTEGFPETRGGRGVTRLHAPATFTVLVRAPHDVCVLMQAPADEELFVPAYDGLEWIEDTFASVVHDAHVDTVFPRAVSARSHCDALRARRYAAISAAGRAPGTGAPEVPVSHDDLLDAMWLHLQVMHVISDAVRAVTPVASAAGIVPAQVLVAGVPSAVTGVPVVPSDAPFAEHADSLRNAFSAHAAAATASLVAAEAAMAASVVALQHAETADATARDALPEAVRTRIAGIFMTALRNSTGVQRLFTNSAVQEFATAQGIFADRVSIEEFANLLARACVARAPDLLDIRTTDIITSRIQRASGLARLLAHLMLRTETSPRLLFAMLSADDMHFVSEFTTDLAELHWRKVDSFPHSEAPLDIPGLLGAPPLPSSVATYSAIRRARARVARVAPHLLLQAWVSVHEVAS